MVKTLGERIRIERQKRKMTLEDVSKGTGLSKSYLSQLERGLSQPSVASLKKIGRHLGISVVRLFEERVEENQNGWRYAALGENQPLASPAYSRDVSVVRATRRKGIKLPGSEVIYEILTPDLNRRLEVMYLRISKGDTSGDEPLVDPPGEKFGLVIKGSIEVRAGREVFQLEEGDSICFPSDGPHSWRGVKGNPIEILWVLTPPSF